MSIQLAPNGIAPAAVDSALEVQVRHALTAVEACMAEAVNSDVTVLRDASRHILEAGGKRMRPRLLFLAYAAAGGKNFDAPVPLAAAVELVHTASVVHDDINDHGTIRRGRPSVNALWGRTFALLTGDFLFTKVYELMAPHGDLNILLAEGTVALVEGETLQAAAVKEGNFTQEVYYQIIARKTAALFRSAAAMGAQMADASETGIEALGQYGYFIGMAFQIIDDVLDLTADAAQLGKSAGIDVEQGRGFAMAYAKDESNVDVADPMVAIKQKLMSGSAIQKAHEKANQFVQLAIGALAILPDSEAKDGLIDLAYQVVERSA